MIKRTYLKRSSRTLDTDADLPSKRCRVEEPHAASTPDLSSSPTKIAAVFSDENAPPGTPPSSPPSVHNKSYRRSSSPLAAKPPQSRPTTAQRAPATEMITKQSSTKPKPKPKLTQMRLDLGQATQTCCRTCGMQYRPANDEDRRLHDKFHSQNLEGIRITTYLAHKLRERQEDWSDELVVLPNPGFESYRNMIRRVLDVVEMELGGVGIPDKELWGMVEVPQSSSSDPVPQSATTKVVASPQRQANQKEKVEKVDRYCAFLYLKEDKVIGVLLAERIFAAHPVENAAVPDKSIQVGVGTVPATMGISRIWVSKHARHKGIAGKLLDAARRSFVWHCKLPKTMIAFSQPTAMGVALASKWFGREDGWLVYQ